MLFINTLSSIIGNDCNNTVARCSRLHVIYNKNFHMFPLIQNVWLTCDLLWFQVSKSTRGQSGVGGGGDTLQVHDVFAAGSFMFHHMSNIPHAAL